MTFLADINVEIWFGAVFALPTAEIWFTCAKSKKKIIPFPWYFPIILYSDLQREGFSFRIPNIWSDNQALPDIRPNPT